MTRTGQLTPTTAVAVELPTTQGPIAALRCGAHETGGEVLLLPGFTGSKEDFTPLLDPLADHGYRVTAIDLPGQFDSPGPHDPDAYTPDELALAVHAVAQSLSGPVHLVGHSFGGLVARAAVIARPELFTDLVLMSSGPAGLTGARRERIEVLEPLMSQGLPAVYAAIVAAYAHDPGYVQPPPELAAFLERRFLSGSAQMLLGMGDALRREPDRVDELVKTGVPVFVLYGADDDAWAPSQQLEMARRLRAGVAMIPGAAHSPAVENTADTAAAMLTFWSQARLAIR
ncbi:MAG TPA: alpha/beta hydrolase [Jatrophihabitantaceae bacterium]|jgi:pimeloyl-ACP methyl ester carboxylesterase